MKKFNYFSCLYIFYLLLPSLTIAEFFIEPVSHELFQEMCEKNVWSNITPFPYSRLKVVHVSYYDFDGIEHEDGKIMVFDAVARNVQKIFQELHALKFPLQKVALMNHYFGEDSLSLEANNSSSFCSRPIVGGSKISLHALGLAIDINPIHNPFIEIDEQSGVAKFSPKSGIQYINRTLERPGKAFRPGMAEQVVAIFSKYGFNVWGGNWDTPVDYQHFQLSRSEANYLISLPPEKSREYFEQSSQARNQT